MEQKNTHMITITMAAVIFVAGYVTISQTEKPKTQFALFLK